MMTNSLKRIKIRKVKLDSTIPKKKILSRREERNHSLVYYTGGDPKQTLIGFFVFNF